MARQQQIFAAVRAKVRDLDANLPLYDMRTMDEQISSSLLIERLIASLSTVFGFLATLLAIIGLYGVMAYTVARRTREIGIRMALGAFQKDVIWLVMREVLVLVAIGIVAGLAASIRAHPVRAGAALWNHSSRSGNAGPGELRACGRRLAAGYIPALARQPRGRHARPAVRVNPEMW